MAQDLEWAAERLAILARHLKDAGEGGLQRRLGKAVSDAAQPVEDAVRAGLKDYMPDPYAAVLAASLRFTTYKRLSGASPSVRVTVSAPTFQGSRGRNLPRLERGVLGHPVFGMRSRANPRLWAAWEYQGSHVEPGFFTRPAEKTAPAVREKIIAAVDETSRQVTEGV